MKNKLKAIYFMWGAYIIAFIICVILTLNSETTRISNIIINVGFFLIVLLLFLYASYKFITLNKLVNDIKKATDTINSDYALNSRQLLWENYRNKSHLFESNELNALFLLYLEENNRLNDNDEFGVYGDIEDYINYQVIDSYVKKNVLNLYSGTMTGLGILGTFIGLSLGLRNFNTGTAEEISQSIAPLMDGIKVAFHTSIFGMLLSLLFNIGYKSDLELAYDTVDRFIDTFKSKVVPNPESSTYKLVVKYQKQQAEEITNLANSLSEQMAEKMVEVLVPQFDKMNNTIEHFTDVASKAQVEGVGVIVDNFVNEMNKSLGESFKALSEVINDTCEWQKQNVGYMQDILQRVSDMTVNIKEINELSSKTVESMSSYINDIEGLQKLINENMMSINLQLDSYGDINEKQKNYIETLVKYEESITESSKAFSADMVKQIAILKEMEEGITKNTVASIEILTKQAEESNKAISEAAKKQIENIINVSSTATSDMNSAARELGKISAQLNGQLNKSLTDTFDLFDKELAEITKHLSGTIAEVDSTTERVPKVVMSAYDGMQKSFEEMEKNIGKLVHSIETLRRKIDAQIKIYEN